ncbi:LCP family protein [Paenibacillus beijingensis]|uniref:Cell envelope-related transcriptional attenuator domain-containing protein n=1 Tax=Paenibacillus beijingensis TaxID=1126833 RepID=A0A0D5NMG4_9BACL|nr:LCP family protein [Paenibacillus beijingensis]AJY76350.1 hypothetical protein VN24_19485 [Paenibacillus beijingensis]
MNSGTNLPPRSARQGGPNRGNPSKKQVKSMKSASRVRRIFFRLIMLLVVGAACFAGYLFWKTGDAINNISGVETTVPASESVKNKPVAMLLMGVDTRSGTGGSLNTDVLMVAAFHPDSKSATVVSIPRDSRIPVEGYRQRKANGYYAAFISNAKDKNSKLTQTEAEQIARDEMKSMLGDYFGIDIKYSAIINFQGFADVIDALGGVNVNVDMDMDYDDHAGQPGGTSIHLKKGPQKLNGEDALGYVRYRKSNNGKNPSSDFDRNRRQSEVVGAITDELKSVGGISRLGSVIGAVGHNMKTDIPKSEIQNFMKTYFGISKENVNFIPLEGTWKSPYVYLNDSSVEKAKASLQAKLTE